MNFAVANLKMKLTREEMEQWNSNWKEFETNFENVTTIVSPSYLHLHTLDCKYIAAQDISIYEKGSYTGEVGGFQIKEYAKYVIVGHSERKEDLQTVRQKTQNCLQNNLKPIVCFTEPTKAADYLQDNCILAWEDPGNIASDGIFKPKDPKEIEAGIRQIRETIPMDTVLLYGGSVNRDNIDSLNEIEGVNGALIGTASLDPKHFYDICIALNK